MYCIKLKEIHGNKLAIDEPATTIDTKLEDEKKVATIDPLKHYSLFSKDMYKLILNDLFAEHNSIFDQGAT